VSQGGELLSQREILEDKGVSRSDESATGPDNELEEQTHRGNMRPDLSACKRTCVQTMFSSTVRRTEYWRGTAGENTTAPASDRVLAEKTHENWSVPDGI